MEDLVKNIVEIAKTKEYPMSISYGIVDVLPCTSTALERILKEADERLYHMKGNLHKEKNSIQ